MSVLASERYTLAPVDEIVDNSLQLWRDSSPHFPGFRQVYARQDQLLRQGRLDVHLDAIEYQLRRESVTQRDAEQTIRHMIPQAAQAAAEALDMSDPQVQRLLQDGLSQISFDLLHQARKLDAAVSLTDVLQAARNAWTACALQLLLRREIRLSPSIFAYSMLYPYSDNYLDDPAVSSEGKRRFSQRFRCRLEGEAIAAADHREEIIWALVDLIEGEYPRAHFPQVYASLLAIHAAQQESIVQMHGGMGHPCDIERLTFTKGGTSVLADAYLAAGHLTGEEAQAAFNWGVVLQLGDDLQDLEADQKKGSLTLFSRSAYEGTLDQITNRTFHFARKVFECSCFQSSSLLHELLARSSRLLLTCSAAGVPALYSAAYLERLEQHSPITFEYVRGRGARFSRGSRLYSRLFEQLSAPTFAERVRPQAGIEEPVFHPQLRH